MYYRLSHELEKYFLNKPETGMGYQIIEASKSSTYEIEKYLILNSQIVIEMNESQDEFVKKVISDGILSFKSSAKEISLYNIKVLNEREFHSKVSESKKETKNGAIDYPVEYADGKEMFVRLSAFDNDNRVDKINKKLLPGSYATTEEDYLDCKETNDEPIERYALPGNTEIKWAFYIQPVSVDILQRGIVQPNFGRQGGGMEIYFSNGTSNNTFKKQTAY